MERSRSVNRLAVSSKEGIKKLIFLHDLIINQTLVVTRAIEIIWPWEV